LKRSGWKYLTKNGSHPIFHMNTFLFELCAQSLEAARRAESGGAKRIELCANLPVGGTTPDIELTSAVIKAISIPVHILIRPRGGNFVYSAAEFGLMQRQIEAVKQVGAAGVVLGVLHPDGRVDVERSRVLVEQAHPMKAVFHRAFDETPDLNEALETVIATGVDTLLTSGGQPDVLTGADMIGKLRAKAGDRLNVMAGGGLRLANLVEVLQRSGVTELHGSLTARQGQSAKVACAEDDCAVRESDVREAIRLFEWALSMREAPQMNVC
jgi:copper homeostasis protein